MYKKIHRKIERERENLFLNSGKLPDQIKWENEYNDSSVEKKRKKKKEKGFSKISNLA